MPCRKSFYFRERIFQSGALKLLCPSVRLKFNYFKYSAGFVKENSSQKFQGLLSFEKYAQVIYRLHFFTLVFFYLKLEKKKIGVILETKISGFMKK